MTATLNTKTTDPKPLAGHPRTGSSFRPDIQGLRAFAVVAVLLDHLLGWPSGGFVGVDIFFVISGFLITGLLLREHERTGRISFRTFYERRVKRILPASLLALVATCAASLMLLPGSRSTGALVDGIWSIFFAGNWRFALTGTDYFQEGTLPSPLRHYWSLGVEEQFYMVWPWLMVAVVTAAAWWARRRAAAGRAPSRQPGARHVLGLTMGVIILVSFGWSLVQTGSNPTVAYFSTLTRAWELGLGALLAVAAPLLERLPAGLRPVLAWLGLTGMVASILVVPETGGFPAPWALAPVLSVGLVIAAGSGHPARGLWPLTNRGSRYLGDISFSLYLWHWPVVVLLPSVVAVEGIRYYALALVLALGLSIASYHLVENPLRKATWVRPRGQTGAGRSQLRRAAVVASWWTVATGVVVMMVLAGSLAALAHRGTVQAEAEAQAQAQSGDVPVPAADPLGSGPPLEACFGAAAVATGEACEGILEDTVSPSIDTFAEDADGQFKCWRSNGEPAYPECHLGNPDGELRVALLGDSHAASLLPAVEAVAEERDWALDVYTGYSCHWYTRDEGENCSGPLQDANEAMLTGDPYDAVLVTSSRYDRVRPVPDRIDRYVDAWTPVAERGSQIIVIEDLPASTEESLQCLTRFDFSAADNDCGMDRAEAYSQPDVLPEAASRVPGAEVVDLGEYFCSESFCPSVIGHAVVYRDAAAHMSATYARTLTPMLGERVDEILND
ncbi:acyltransferase family protein [Citricoccus nitrophenolicus]|uniref:acyltransferase family protein n=1 Tax=Citricoccus nitrophenolicus TaxID=863575 RepID=UPI0031E7C41A